MISGVGAFVSLFALWAIYQTSSAAIENAETASGQLKQIELENRAWLSIEPSKVDPIKVGFPITGTGEIRNSGKTPGRIVAEGGNIFLRQPTAEEEADLDQTIEDNLKEYDKMDPNVEYTVAPGNTNVYPLEEFETLEQHKPMRTTQQELDDITSGKIVVAVFRYLRYRDVFGKLHHSWSLFLYPSFSDKPWRYPQHDHMD